MVRIHSDSIYESGEYAILLRSDLKGRGLGWALMQMIIEYAKSEGLKAISGDVLAENTVMLAMCRSLGFEVKSDPTGARHLQRQADALNRIRSDAARLRIDAGAYRQCENRIGSGGFDSRLLVAPPRMNSRHRACP